MVRVLCLVVALLILGSAREAAALGKGSSMLAIELTGGTAHLSDYISGPSGYLGIYSVPEVGIQAQFWNLRSDDYALALSVGTGFSRETYQPGAGSLPGAPEVKVETSSFNVRVGGDRILQVSERTVMYGGPGVEYWDGKARFGDIRTKRYGLSTRLGATMLLGTSTGLTAHFGHRIGYASTTASGDGKATWWPSSFEGSMGLVFSFGGTTP